MSGVNLTIVMGRLGQDPEVAYTSNGNAVCKLSIATSEQWKNKTTGEKEEKTEWHSCICWGDRGVSLAQYFKKGDMIWIRGRLQTRKWDKDGVTHYKTEHVINDWQFTGGKSGASSTQVADQQEAAGRPMDGDEKPARQDAAPSSALDKAAVDDDFSDDIPFAFLIGAPLLTMLVSGHEIYQNMPQMFG